LNDLAALAEASFAASFLDERNASP